MTPCDVTRRVDAVYCETLLKRAAMPVIILPARPEKSLKKRSFLKSPLNSPTKFQNTARCAALDASRILCNLPNQQGTMWCPRHNEERVKLYVNYKKHHAALDAFPEDKIYRANNEVMSCSSLDVLCDWNQALMAKYQLLTR